MSNFPYQNQSLQPNIQTRTDLPINHYNNNNSQIHPDNQRSALDRIANGISYLHTHDIVVGLSPVWCRQLTQGLSSVLASNELEIQFSEEGLNFNYNIPNLEEFGNFTTLYQGFEFIGVNILKDDPIELESHNSSNNNSSINNQLRYYYQQHNSSAKLDANHISSTTHTIQRQTSISSTTAVIQQISRFSSVFKISPELLQASLKGKNFTFLFLCFSIANNSITIHIDSSSGMWTRNSIPVIDIVPPDLHSFQSAFDQAQLLFPHNPSTQFVKRSDFIPFPTDVFLQLNIQDIRSIQQNIIKPTRNNGDFLQFQLQPQHIIKHTLPPTLKELSSQQNDIASIQGTPQQFVFFAQHMLKCYRQQLGLQNGFTTEQLGAFVQYRTSRARSNLTNMDDSDNENSPVVSVLNTLPQLFVKYVCNFQKQPKTKSAPSRSKRRLTQDIIEPSSVSSLQYSSPTKFMNPTVFNEPTQFPPIQMGVKAHIPARKQSSKRNGTQNKKEVQLIRDRCPNYTKFRYAHLREYCWPFYHLFNPIPTSIEFQRFNHYYKPQEHFTCDNSSLFLPQSTLPHSSVKTTTSSTTSSTTSLQDSNQHNYISQFYRLFGDLIDIRSQPLEFAAQIAQASGMSECGISGEIFLQQFNPKSSKLSPVGIPPDHSIGPNSYSNPTTTTSSSTSTTNSNNNHQQWIVSLIISLTRNMYSISLHTLQNPHIPIFQFRSNFSTPNLKVTSLYPLLTHLSESYSSKLLIEQRKLLELKYSQQSDEEKAQYTKSYNEFIYNFLSNNQHVMPQILQNQFLSIGDREIPTHLHYDQSQHHPQQLSIHLSSLIDESSIAPNTIPHPLKIIQFEQFLSPEEIETLKCASMKYAWRSLQDGQKQLLADHNIQFRDWEVDVQQYLEIAKQKCSQQQQAQQQQRAATLGIRQSVVKDDTAQTRFNFSDAMFPITKTGWLIDENTIYLLCEEILGYHQTWKEYEHYLQAIYLTPDQNTIPTSLQYCAQALEYDNNSANQLTSLQHPEQQFIHPRQQSQPQQLHITTPAATPAPTTFTEKVVHLHSTRHQHQQQHLGDNDDDNDYNQYDQPQGHLNKNPQHHQYHQQQQQQQNTFQSNPNSFHAGINDHEQQEYNKSNAIPFSTPPQTIQSSLVSPSTTKPQHLDPLFDTNSLLSPDPIHNNSINDGNDLTTPISKLPNIHHKQNDKNSLPTPKTEFINDDSYSQSQNTTSTYSSSTTHNIDNNDNINTDITMYDQDQLQVTTIPQQQQSEQQEQSEQRPQSSINDEILPSVKLSPHRTQEQQRQQQQSQFKTQSNLQQLSATSIINNPSTQFLNGGPKTELFAAETQLQFSNTQNHLSNPIISAITFGDQHDEHHNITDQEDDMFGLENEIDFEISYANTDTQIPALRSIKQKIDFTQNFPQSFTNSAVSQLQPLLPTLITPIQQQPQLTSPQSTLTTINSFNLQPSLTQQQQFHYQQSHPQQQQQHLQQQSTTIKAQHFDINTDVYDIHDDGPLEDDGLFASYNDDGDDGTTDFDIQQQLYGLSLQNQPQQMGNQYHNHYNQTHRNQLSNTHGANTDYLLIDVDDDDDIYM